MHLRTMPAVGTLVDVTAERRRPATDDRGKDLQVQPVNHFRLRA